MATTTPTPTTAATAAAASAATSQHDLDGFTQGLYRAAHAVTQISNRLPLEDDFAFHKATTSGFNASMSAVALHAVTLLQQIVNSDPSAQPLDALGSVDDVDEFMSKLPLVIDANETRLEAVEQLEDEISGAKNTQPPAVVISSTSVRPSRGDKDYNLFHANNVVRPQNTFNPPVDNSNNPFRPSITHKPNARKPLDPVFLAPSMPGLPSGLESHASALGISVRREPYPHPYQYELDHLEFLDSQLQAKPEELYQPLSQSYTWVDTKQGLDLVVAHLNTVSEVAIDLEQHSFRSFQGFVCLMQISTRTRDFLIDTLVLRSQMQVLNDPFTNPKIVKVLHGSDSDIEWLQRDFSLYIVNLFDTGQAMRVLEFPKFSLQYLLDHYCGVKLDKKYQLADWRIRPLPEVMLTYARQDTHYLLYVYDRLKNELLARGNESKNLLLAVLNRSRELCLKRYEKELFDAQSHMALYRKYSYFLSESSMRVYEAIYAWRDHVAREEDESPRFVLPNHQMFKIAESPPSDTHALFRLCQPVIPPFIKSLGAELVDIIKRAHKSPAAITSPLLSAATTTATASSQSHLKAPTPVRISSMADAATSSHHHHLEPAILALGSQQPLSPAPSADQLYEQAGWVESALKGPSRVECSAHNDDFNASRPIGSKSLYSFVSDDDDDDHHTPKPQHTPELRRSLNQRSLAMATYPPRSHSSSLFAIPLPMPEATSGSANDNGDDNVVERVVEEPVTPVAKSSGAASSSISPGAAGRNESPNANVPKSMAEIYQLSNLNRKRNKEKKKRKGDSMDDDDSDGESSTATSSSSKRKVFASHDSSDDEDSASLGGEQLSQSPHDTAQFMRSIGWLGAGDSLEMDNASHSGNSAGQLSSAAADGAGDKRKHRRSKSRDDEAASRLKARKKPSSSAAGAASAASGASGAAGSPSSPSSAKARNKNHQTYPPPKSKFTQFDYAAAAHQPTMAATSRGEHASSTSGGGDSTYTPSVSAPTGQRTRGQSRPKSGQRSQTFRGGSGGSSRGGGRGGGGGGSGSLSRR